MRFTWLASLLVACSSQHATVTPDGAPDIDAPDVDAPVQDATVTFSYTPAWSGVQSVEVLGAFGQASDWTAPLVTLTASGGTWSGTAQLPAGTYLYVFKVVGDTDAGATKAATYSRYALDPSAGYSACPAQSPTYSAMVANPCSQLVVPTTSAPTMYHVTGKVVVNGAAAANYLVVLEREETGSHHFFVNRMTTGADGMYDLQAAAGGMYRIQIQHPQYESKTDAQLDPISLGILRRKLTTAFALSADYPVPAAEMAFASYSSFAPTTTGTMPMPTMFSFGTTVSSRFDVYGGANEIGDPWYNSTATTAGQFSYDGSFNTGKSGTQTAVQAGTKYYWGLEQNKAASPITWTSQTLVFPITWN